MDWKRTAFRPASFDAEEFLDDLVDPTDIPDEGFDLLDCEAPDTQVDPGITASVTADYVKDLAAISERLTQFVIPLGVARNLGEKLPETIRAGRHPQGPMA